MTGASRLALLVVGMALGACASALPPVPAPRPTPLAWTETPFVPDVEVEDRWWLAFDDPVLTELIDQADDADDIALAQARLDVALARLGAARARLRPDLSATANADSQRVDDLEQDQIQGLLALAWSPDLNGALAARTRADEAATLAEAARLAAVRQATRATAARLYVAWVEAAARADTADRSVAALSDSLALSDTRARAGLTSGLDPAAAQAQLSAARARPVAAREAADTARLGLEALLGLAPGTLRSEPVGAAPMRLSEAAPGLLAPVAVLARRPDVGAAEADLLASGFQADAARRDFWPSLSLSAALGGQEAEPITPFTASGGLVQVAGTLAGPLFSFGRLEAERDGADARRLEAALTLRRTATQALAEVEQALVADRSAGTRTQALGEAVAAGRDRVSLASSRYRAGLSPLLDVLVAQDALAVAEADLATARGDQARARIAIAVAMGLGAA